MSNDLEERLDAVYGTNGDREKLDEIYDDWSRDYDQTLWASGNPYLALMNGLVGRYVPDTSAKILDAGCGTGNMGELLRGIGYTNISGLDASDGMLAAAKTKGCYTELHQTLLGAQIALPANSFDAITAGGVLTHGHAPPESMDGLLEIAKPGAPIIFSISKPGAEESGFGDKFTELENAGAWTLEEKTAPFRTYPFSEQYADLRHWVCVYRKPR